MTKFIAMPLGVMVVVWGTDLLVRNCFYSVASNLDERILLVPYLTISYPQWV